MTLCVCLDIFSLQRFWEIVDSLFCQVGRGNRCFSLLFLRESWFQAELRARLIQSQTQKERRRGSAEDITKEDAKIRKKTRKDEEVV